MGVGLAAGTGVWVGAKPPVTTGVLVAAGAEPPVLLLPPEAVVGWGKSVGWRDGVACGTELAGLVGAVAVGSEPRGLIGAMVGISVEAGLKSSWVAAAVAASVGVLVRTMNEVVWRGWLINE